MLTAVCMYIVWLLFQSHLPSLDTQCHNLVRHAVCPFLNIHEVHTVHGLSIKYTHIRMYVRTCINGHYPHATHKLTHT